MDRSRHKIYKCNALRRIMPQVGKTIAPSCRLCKNRKNALIFKSVPFHGRKHTWICELTKNILLLMFLWHNLQKSAIVLPTKGTRDYSAEIELRICEAILRVKGSFAASKKCNLKFRSFFCSYGAYPLSQKTIRWLPKQNVQRSEKVLC
jgi:hypothetical protein